MEFGCDVAMLRRVEGRERERVQREKERERALWSLSAADAGNDAKPYHR